MPPISKEYFLKRADALAAIPLPTAVDPVNATIRMRSSSISLFPTSSPEPGTRLNTPFGIPAPSRALAIITPETGVALAGLSTKVLPAARAKATFLRANNNGKLKGAIPATTPRGSLRIMDISPASCCWTGPTTRRHSPAAVLSISTANPASKYAFPKAEPLSPISTSATSSMCSCIQSAAFRRICSFWAAGVSAHGLHALWAAAMASSTSAPPAKCTLANTESSAGFLSSATYPVTVSFHSPFMYN